MRQVREIVKNIYWVGASDRRLALFENVFPIPRGVSYNAYLALGQKNVLLDTVDKSVAGVFFENLQHLLQGKNLDYVIVNHVEPDHAGTLGELVLRYPQVKIVGNEKTLVMLARFFDFSQYNYDFTQNSLTVKEMDTLDCGEHKFTFAMAKMVHWPEAMVSYETTTRTLFSADAFGTFGALNGNIFADEVNFERDWLDDARRYYTNIVGKYGNQVQAALTKLAGLKISRICPLHGPIWRKNLDWFIEKYQRWSGYVPEDTAIVIAYASVYGNTENTANLIAAALAERGLRDIKMFDVSATHPSEILAQAFRCSHLVICSTTYNSGIFCNMETLLTDLKAHNFQKRTVAIVENGSWAPTAGKLIREIFQTMPKMTILNESLTIESSLKANNHAGLQKLVNALVDSMTKAPVAKHDAKSSPIQNEIFFKLSYGLFLLSVKDGEKDNACIINTVQQVTDQPKRITVAVNKANFTHDMILHTGIFNVSILSVDAPFSLFERFGFHSGRDTDKFAGLNYKRSVNDLHYDNTCSTGFISGKVINTIDCGTHSLFVANVTEAGMLASSAALTYQYYFDNIKPKPAVTGGRKSGFVCKICGYIHESDTLPADFICPLCKHGASDFEKLPDAPSPKNGWVCKICGYVHENDTLPADFICPLCKHGASDFERLK